MSIEAPGNEPQSPEDPEVLEDLLEEELIARVHGLVESEVSHPTKEGNGKLHRILSVGHYARVYREYDAGAYLPIEILGESANRVAGILEKTFAENPEGAKLQRNYFLARLKTIRSSCIAYANSVASFHSIKRQQLRLEPEDFSYKLQQIDGMRKRRHDSLIKSLYDYNVKIAELVKQGTIPEGLVAEWGRASSTEETIFVFPKGFLEGRERIRDWAIAVDLKDNLVRADESLQKLYSKES